MRDRPNIPSLENFSDRQVLALWASTMSELKLRGILRSDNTPTGDYAEWVVSEALGMLLEAKSKTGFDATDTNGLRYQIKARRLMTPKTPRHLSVLRNLDGDPFDFLIIVLFGPTFDVLECWQVPIEVVRKHATYIAYVNAHRLIARGPVLNDPQTKRLSSVEEWVN